MVRDCEKSLAMPGTTQLSGPALSNEKLQEVIGNTLDHSAIEADP